MKYEVKDGKVRMTPEDSLDLVVAIEGGYRVGWNRQPRGEAGTSPEKIIHNPRATVVIWRDGTKTVVKPHSEPYDAEKGVAMAFIKRWHPEEYKKLLKAANANAPKREVKIVPAAYLLAYSDFPSYEEAYHFVQCADLIRDLLPGELNIKHVIAKNGKEEFRAWQIQTIKNTIIEEVENDVQDPDTGATEHLHSDPGCDPEESGGCEEIVKYNWADPMDDSE